MKSVKSPLAGWFGGKYQLSKKIIDRIPEHKCYAEPFSGAAWVLFRKEESECEVVNDINVDVVNLYRVVQNHLEEFAKQFKWILISRKEFERRWLENPETLTDIQRAARFYYLQRNAFAGRVTQGKPSFGTGTTRSPRLDLLRYEEDLTEAHLRLINAYIENLPYSDLIAKYDRKHTFFYLDPPYWDCEEDYGKGIFGKEDFQKIAHQMAGIKGKFLLSINDRPEIREIFSDFNIEQVTVTYSCSRKTRPKVSELFITNYDYE